MKQIDPTIFKAYDIRGTYPDQFDEDIAYRIARAYAQKVKPKLVVVGRDMRTSGPSIVDAVTRGLIEQGCGVVHIGVTSTPMFYYAVNALEGDAGIMITASHNPEGYNGFKMTGPEAIPSIAFVSNEELYGVSNAGVFEASGKKGEFRGEVSPLEGYIDAALKTSGVKDFGDLKIVIDAANGMGGMILPHLLAKANCTVFPLYWEVDGTFPNHEANPIKDETLDALKARVIAEGAHLGVAYDGDGDRVGFVDEKGNTVPGDMITALIAKEMLKEKPGAKIIYDLRSSWAVKEEIKAAGGEPVIYKVGHGLIKRYMREIGAYFGGELSSHYYFSNFYITDNGDLAMLKIIQLLVAEKQPLSELVAPMLRYHHSPEINSTVKDVNAKLAEIKEIYKAGHQFELDGLTVEFDDWWFNVRPSQTEPLLRLNVEAKTAEALEARTEELLHIIRS
ncbi:MAG: phosphomannomutase/phosphoglucomutase [Armatimonadetes bacterium]|nr:phosphomannomutase/phosphoglucomutase [Armatimonadota bacterium]